MNDMMHDKSSGASFSATFRPSNEMQLLSQRVNDNARHEQWINVGTDPDDLIRGVISDVVACFKPPVVAAPILMSMDGTVRPIDPTSDVPVIRKPRNNKSLHVCEVCHKIFPFACLLKNHAGMIFYLSRTRSCVL